MAVAGLFEHQQPLHLATLSCGASATALMRALRAGTSLALYRSGSLLGVSPIAPLAAFLPATLLPATTLFGTGGATLASLLGRLGIALSLLGAPFFLGLLLRLRRGLA